MATLLPGLVFDYAAGDEQRTTLYSLADGAHHPSDFMDALRGKRMWVTPQGWVLVWDPATLATFLWNPHDGARVALPPLAQAPPVGMSCAMSGKPTDVGGCTVVILDALDSKVMWYYRHGGGSSPATAEWLRYEYDLGGKWVQAPWVKGGEIWLPKVISKLAPCGGGGGRFCTLLSSEEYVVLDFSPPEPVMTTATMTKPVEMTMIPGEKYTNAFVYSLDLDGDFHTVWVFFSDIEGTKVAVIDVAVNRIDFTTDQASGSAVRVNSIGDRAIIVGGSNGSLAGWCPATELGLLPNSVYWMNRNSGRLHVHDIGARTEEVREVGHGVTAELACKPFWMIPVHT